MLCFCHLSFFNFYASINTFLFVKLMRFENIQLDNLFGLDIFSIFCGNTRMLQNAQKINEHMEVFLWLQSPLLKKGRLNPLR